MQLFLVSLILVSTLSLLYGMGELISSSRKKFGWLLSAAFISIFIMSLHAYFLFTGILLQFPFLLGWYIPFNLLVGPFFSLYATQRLKISNPTKLLPHLIPALISFLLLILFHSDGNIRAIENIELTMKSPTSTKEFPFLGLLNLHFLAYTFFSGWKILNSIGYRKGINEDTCRLMLIILIFTALISTFSFLGFLLRSIILLEVSVLMLNVFLIGLYFIRLRVPEFFGELEKIVRKGKYEKSRLKEYDLKNIKTELDQLIHTDKIYCDEDISLQSLATELGLSQHQLSEFFNDHLKKNFVSYINGFRIRDAKKLLREERETTVLAIAYQVGFNSKSAFNSAFQKEVGCSPSVYRNNF